MILSVSRRTDIPNYYAEWFMNRLQEGYLYVRNPMNAHQVSKIPLSKEQIDCIVFWTKNPVGIMSHLEELRAYPFYFQFTITGYGQDMERNIPDKKTVIIPRFQELSREIGKERVIWRYDPILFTKRYSTEYHLRAFRQMAESLCGYTEKCVISFVDIYRKNQSALAEMENRTLSETTLRDFAKSLHEIAAAYGIRVATCSEQIDLSDCGIAHNCCIDRELIERITGNHFQVGKDPNQRKECGCVESIEVGSYNTCANGCAYCYAAFDDKSVQKSRKCYNPHSPLLCGEIEKDDKITERKLKQIVDTQMRLEDWMGNGKSE